MAELGVGFACDERGPRRRDRMTGADRAGGSREQDWPPRRSRPTGHDQRPSRAVLSEFTGDASNDREWQVGPAY